MERSEAEAIYAQGRAPVVDALLALSARLQAQDAHLAALAERVEELEQRLKRDSRNFEPIIGSTVDAFAAAKVGRVVPAHCTGWKAVHVLAQAMPEAFVQPAVGTVISF